MENLKLTPESQEEKSHHVSPTAGGWRAPWGAAVLANSAKIPDGMKKLGGVE